LRRFQKNRAARSRREEGIVGMMDPRVRGSLPWLALASLALLLSACGGGDSPASFAATSDVSIAGTEPGSSDFIAWLRLSGTSVAEVAGVDYTIAPKPGAVSRPVRADFTIDALQRRGYVDAASQHRKIPIVGLYGGYTNRVTVVLRFADGSTQALAANVATVPYSDPNGIYDHLTIRTPRVAGSTLGFDFMLLKSVLGMPVVVDTDGEVRWMGASSVAHGGSIAFEGDGFVVGDDASPRIFRFDLDGSMSQTQLEPPAYTKLSHNLDPGKQALLAEPDVSVNGVVDIGSTLAEITGVGAVLDQWEFGALLSAYMRDHGDDPAAFVRPGTDWFHLNAAAYDPRDDSLIVSSRENFVVKVNYASGDIVWIFGDPTKYWYAFPSLRAKALALDPGGLYPIGQHAVSITSDGLLLLFNDGEPSLNQPPGAPAGASRAYSAVSAYSIDPSALTAREMWRFDYDQTILSTFCSSAYEASGKSILVDYAMADGGTKARLVGLGADHNVVFDFEYPTHFCDTAWNAQPIAFDNLQFN
jgi:hypothetical protein